ncbi:molybdate ABC transporter substrate-binding protein [Herbivorax sp. ANBcel31]|uniref:molybdate ABC transporter substrate-binding protein n=1 Tax=Herbivorax sp. ANBcel31 TaxID=3069754 RepID=UPI0027B46E2D|nr:molybdate ABC transporter substrate-binding protein [Herbivorax sp. ANBcel31]MDQ2087102.1 molybdate ABC transporter substrate-binding protein [Herbivorax sp. ANBcel31]
MRAIIISLLGVTLCFIFLIGCNAFSKDDNFEEITVLAAGSLTESLTEIKENFENLQEESVKININFAGSQTLKTYIQRGEKADVFLSANLEYMDALVEEGFVDKYSVFAKNRLVLIKNNKSKYKVESLEDLYKEGLNIAAGNKSVPVGSYWNESLEIALKNKIISNYEKSKILSNIVTEELNVKDVVSKVLFGEVDVGVVYRTDVTEGIKNEVEIIELEIFNDLYAKYPIALIIGDRESGLSEEFYEFILYESKDVLKKYGFIVD